ncbi:unnamed protein product [Clonostachys chloroleuca]|uniref:Alpha/beta hydrolase fold-3 domain-containing protein n=1 Tax=Clonostachys chloroleuca TaxID=1926264 RepID=A0AA35QB00_9HYPO|nr:unnamed protein product [Clonostachys chloroleuca]
MIDHVLGRPSTKSRRLQVLAVLSFWTVYLYRGDRHGPPGAQRLSRLFSKRLTAWQTVALTMLYLYAARNFSALVGLASPEPMANMYDPTYFRATWVLTALDAGFWTAMKIKTRWLRDIASIVFSVFYLFATERADEKVRKVRGMITIDHLRVSWNKSTTPYLGFFQRLIGPRFTRWPPRQVRIPRPKGSDYKEPVMAWLYYDGPLAQLEHHNRLVVDIPGGGFVAMDPRCNDDKLFAWAAKSGLPILSLDYRKAPEYPFPYALNECFDVYTTLIQTRGRCIGMSGRDVPKIILTGDSAGGNLAVAATLMVLETGSAHKFRCHDSDELPPPDGLVCFYPALDMNIGNWMTDEELSLIRDRNMRKTNKSVVRRKSREYNDLVGTPHHSDDEDEKPTTPELASDSAIADDSEAGGMSDRPARGLKAGASRALDSPQQGAGIKRTNSTSHHPEPMKTRLATSSMISYFNDRVLTPEMMRAMIILYIGPHNRPDFGSDYLLSPVLAPESLLADFPRTYFMTGERDPLVDDTVILAGRIRRAKEAAARRRMDPGSAMSRQPLSEEELKELGAAEVMLIPGTSHGFMQFPALYPPAWRHFERCAEWFEQLFAHADSARLRRDQRRASEAANQMRHYSMVESSGEEDKPLEMTMTKIRGGRGSLVSAHGRRKLERRAASGEAEQLQNGMGPEGELGESGTSSPKKAATASPKTNGNSTGGRKGGRKTLTKDKSLVKLGSSEDLLMRRMQGLTSGLTGMGDDD